MPLRLHLRWPRRTWWLVSSQGDFVSDYHTHRSASRTADTLNARQITRGRAVRFHVVRKP